MNTSLFILLLLTSLQASMPEDPPQFRTIKLSEFTRGTMRIIEVTPKQYTVILNARTERGIIEPAEWKRIVKEASKLPLYHLSDVPVPSKRHQVDAALSASLTFVMRDTSVFTPTFDHNNPPEAYLPLIDLLYQQVPASMKDDFKR